MNVVSVFDESNRYLSRNRLLGLTVGGYATLSIWLFCFGGASTISLSQIREGNTQAFLLIIPGLLIGLLDFVQIHAEDYFSYKPGERITIFALQLNAIPVLGFCVILILKEVLDGGVYSSFVLVSVAVVTLGAFFLGIAVSLINVLWILFASKARIALVTTVFPCLLPTLWPAYLAGLFTTDAGRFANRKEETIYLHPSDVSFQIPNDWLDWNAQFHNNFHLTHGELKKVRFGAGEWDYEYGAVVNSALPFEDCAAHVGGEGWGREGRFLWRFTGAHLCY
jgi:hypothetical protein